MIKYFLLFYLLFIELQESEDSNQQNDVIIGSWNFVSESEYRDYECTEPYDDWEFELPGISINGTSIPKMITSLITFEVTKEWMCADVRNIIR